MQLRKINVGAAANDGTGEIGPRGWLQNYNANFNTISQNVDEVRIALGQSYDGSGDVLPFITDAANRVLFGFRLSSGALIGAGLINKDVAMDLTNRQLADASCVQYVGAGTVIPFFLAGNKVLLGYDTVAGQLVGALPSTGGGGGAIRSALVPLASGDLPTAGDIDHFIVYGQSLAVGARGVPTLSTSQSYGHLTFENGVRSTGRVGTLGGLTAFADLVENTLTGDGSGERGETVCSATANYATELAAVEDGIDYALSSSVTLASAPGHGGYTIDQLSPGVETAGEEWWKNLEDHIQAGRDLAVAASKTYVINEVMWMQGEGNYGDAQATYFGKLSAMRDAIQATYETITGNTNRIAWLSYQTTWGVRTYPGVALAQLQYITDPANHAYLAAPMYQFPYADDNIHLTNVGYAWLGHYVGRARKTIGVDKCRHAWLQPVSATCQNQQVRVRFNVPVRPLVIDADGLAATQDSGFQVKDTTGAVDISSISIENGDTVVLTLAAPLAGAATARYALDYLGTGLTVQNGASGNLRDSEPAVALIDGIRRPLFNCAPHFELPIIALA